MVNRGRVGKYNNYYQFIMKAKGMKNHDVHIMHAQQTLSPASYTRGFSMDNLQIDLKHIVAINSLPFNMIFSPGRFVINLICSTCPPVIEPGLNSLRSFPLPIQFVQNLSPCAFVQYTTHRVYLGHTMEDSQSTGKGMWSDITARSEPQRDWDSFSPAATIPKDVEGTILSPTGKIRSSRETTEEDKFIQEGEMVRAPSSQQQLPQRRGRPSKNKEIMKDRITKEPRARLIAEELLRCAIQLESAGKSSHKYGSRERRVDAAGENEEAPYQ
jgi:hypothetical protein